MITIILRQNRFKNFHCTLEGVLKNGKSSYVVKVYPVINGMLQEPIVNNIYLSKIVSIIAYKKHLKKYLL